MYPDALSVLGTARWSASNKCDDVIVDLTPLHMLTHRPCPMQAAGAAALNTGRESVELARHFDQGQQLIQPEREAPGHDAAPRHDLLYPLLATMSLSMMTRCAAKCSHCSLL